MSNEPTSGIAMQRQYQSVNPKLLNEQLVKDARAWLKEQAATDYYDALLHGAVKATEYRVVSPDTLAAERSLEAAKEDLRKYLCTERDHRIFEALEHLFPTERVDDMREHPHRIPLIFKACGLEIREYLTQRQTHEYGMIDGHKAVLYQHGEPVHGFVLP